MSIHIALIGRTREPVLEGIRHYGGVAKVYLLHSPNQEDTKFEQVAMEAKRILSEIGLNEVQLVKINPFEMESTINAIMEIVDKEKGNPLFINITGGTNLMAGAACSAAFITGARAYYVLDTRKMPDKRNAVVELPIPNIPSINSLQTAQLKLLKKIAGFDGKISNSYLRDDSDISPQKLSYHVRELEKKGLVTTHRGWECSTTKNGKTIRKTDSRRLTIELTNAGRLIVNLTRSRIL